MIDLAWVLESEKSTFLGNTGVSSSYLLPKNDVALEPKALAGRRLWVVLRGHEDRLILFIKIKKVERIIEGYYYGDYLFSPEISESVKLVSGYAEAAKYSTPSTRSLKLGVSELPPGVSDIFSVLVKKSVQTKLLPPDKRLLSQVGDYLSPHDSRRLAQSALRAVVSRLTLEQVWSSGKGYKLGAFSNYAYALLSEKTDSEPSPDLIECLKACDPVTLIFSDEKNESEINKPVESSRTPCVDTEFFEIEPGKIYARKFVSLDPKLRDLEAEIIKTEHAEKIHQAMLKDISEFLIGNGITPYESGSIDLTYSLRGKLYVFEIKSANIDNVLSQAAKGAFQLACYQNELSKYYNRLEARLVLHDTTNPDLQNYVTEVLCRLGVEVLFYDPSMHWPHRLKSMPLWHRTAVPIDPFLHVYS